jgi:hypothetical protein
VSFDDIRAVIESMPAEERKAFAPSMRIQATENAMRAEIEEAREIMAFGVTVRCVKSCQGLVAKLDGGLVQFREFGRLWDMPIGSEHWPTKDRYAWCRACSARYPLATVMQLGGQARRRRVPTIRLSIQDRADVATL